MVITHVFRTIYSNEKCYRKHNVKNIQLIVLCGDIELDIDWTYLLSKHT